MLQSVPLGRALPEPPPAIPVAVEEDDDLSAASMATPRSPEIVDQLAHQLLTPAMVARYWMTCGAVSLGLWALGTTIAIITGTGIVALGFGSLAIGLACGAMWIQLRRREAHRIAREGQLLVGAHMGDAITFSVGFIRYQMRVDFVSHYYEEQRRRVLVQPGARYALAFDSHGHAYVGEPRRVA